MYQIHCSYIVNATVLLYRFAHSGTASLVADHFNALLFSDIQAYVFTLK